MNSAVCVLGKTGGGGYGDSAPPPQKLFKVKSLLKVI